LHKFRKERRRSPRGYFKCGDTTHFIANCPKKKKLDSNKYDYTKWNDYSKGDDKKKHRFEDKKKKKKLQKIISRVCATLSDFDFSSDNSSSSNGDEKVKNKSGDFTGLCNQDKLLCKDFCVNKKLNLELKSASSKIASLRSVHDDMSAKPCDNCKMIMVNYVDLWLMHSHVTSLLDSTKLELREHKTRFMLLGACTSCLLLRSNLEASAVDIKDLNHKLDHSSCYTILSPPCDVCGSLKGKLFHATKENTELKQEVAYLAARLEKTVLNEKMIEEDLSMVEESVTKCPYKLGVEFEKCEKRMRKVLLSLFLALATIKKRKQSNKQNPTTHPIQTILQPKERSEERNPQAERGSFHLHVLWPCRSLG
jgi:hypothetical protein